MREWCRICGGLVYAVCVGAEGMNGVGDVKRSKGGDMIRRWCVGEGGDNVKR